MEQWWFDQSFLHFLRNSWLLNKSILKDTLEFFFFYFCYRKTELEICCCIFTSICPYPQSIISTPEEYIKKFPSVSQMSTLFHPLDLSVHKLIENYAPVLHQKKGDNAFPLELLGFGGFLISLPCSPQSSALRGKDSLLLLQICELRCFIFSNKCLQ